MAEQGPAGPPGPAGTGVSDAYFLLSQASTGVANALILTAGGGIQLTPSTGLLTITASGAGTGTVTSVDLAVPTDLFTVTGNPVTTAGTLTLTKASQTSNKFYASPSGASGVPTFRSISANDIAGLFTAGSNISIVGGSTLTISATGLASQYASGTVTSIGMSVPAEFSVTPTSITSTGTFAVTKNNQAAALVYAGPASGSAAQPTFRGLTYLDLPVLAGSNITFAPQGNNITISAAGSGNVSSVGLSAPAEFTVSNSPVTETGTLTFTKVAQSQNQFWGASASGGSTVPSFRTLTYLDLPIVQGSNITLTPVGSSYVISSTASGSGSVSSVGLALPSSILTVSGSPVTGSGTLTGTLANQASGQFWAASPTGAAGQPYFRNIVGSDLNLALQAGLNVTITPSASALVIAASGGSGTVSSVGLSLPNIFTVSGSPVTGSGTLTGTLATQASGTAFMGPTSGANATPTFRALVGSDLSSVIVGGSNVTITPIGNTLVISAAATGGGGGSVTSVSSGNLTNFATVNVAAPTSTPAFTFTLTQAASGQFFGGPTSGSAAAPAYRSLVLSDLPVGTYTSNYSTTLNNFASGSGTGILVQNGSSFVFRSIAGTGNRVSVTNGSGVSGNPTIDVGSDVYTISTSNVLNNLATGVPTAGQIHIGNSSGTFTLATIAAGPGVQVNTGSGFINISATGALGGTVTNFSAGDLAPLFTTTEATTTTTPALTFVQSNAPSGTVVAGPTTGVPGAYTFRALASSDIYQAHKDNLVAGANISYAFNPTTSQITISAAGSSNANGTVTNFSAGDLTPLFTTTEATTTTTPALTFVPSNAASGAALLGPQFGAAGAYTFRQLASSDIYAAARDAFVAGTNITITPNPSTYQLTISALGSSNTNGTVTSVGLSTPGVLFSTANSPITSSGTIALTLINQASGTAFMGPLSGANAAPTFRNLASGDFGSNKIVPSQIGNNVINMGILIDNGASAITAQDEGQFPVNFPCTITGWTLLSATGSGSVTFNVYKSTYASFPSMSSMVSAGTKPSITNGYKGQNLNISDWGTTAVSAGDILKFTIESISGFTQLSIALTAIRTG